MKRRLCDRPNGPGRNPRQRCGALSNLCVGLLAVVLVMGSTTVALAESGPSTWTLPAGQETVVTTLLTVPGLPEPASIAIEKNEIKASYPGGQVLVLVHVGAPERDHLVLKAEGFRAHLASGEWDEATLRKVQSHLKGTPGPQWRQAKAKVAAPKRPKKGRGGRDQRDDRLDQAQHALSLGEKDKARRLLQQLANDQETSSSQKVRVGELLMELGEVDRGKALLDAVVKELKSRADADPAARPSWVDALVRLRPKEAAKIATKELQAAKRPCDWSLVAYNLQRRGERGSAGELATAILAKAPKCEHAWLVKGHVADTGLKSWEAVLAVANDALKQLPNSLPLMNLKAGALHSGWKNREAAEVWEQIARKDINFPGVMGMLATAWTQLPEIEEPDFLAPFEKKLKADPKDVITRYIIGTASYYRDDFESVVKYLDPLREVVPREPRVHLYTAMAHFHLGHRDVAFERLNTLQKFGHGDPDFYYCRSVMTRETDFEGSLRDLETFVRLSKNRLNSDAKIYKMHRELEVMRSGRVPTRFDLLPPLARWSIIGGATLLLLALSLVLWRRRSA